MSTPWWKGSVLLCLMQIFIKDGDEWESRARSARDKWTSGSNSAQDGTVNSPARRKPKNARQQAAQIIGESGECGKWSRIELRISGVMGRRERAGGLAGAWDLLMPLKIHSKRG